MMFSIIGASCLCKSHCNTLARCMALSIDTPEMSHPPMTKSLGWTIGSMSETGTKTSLPVSGSVPSRMVEARTSDPM